MIVIFHQKRYSADFCNKQEKKLKLNKSKTPLITGSLANAPDFIKYCGHYSAQTLPETDRPAEKCEPFLSSGSEQQMNSELHMPFSEDTGHSPLQHGHIPRQ